MFKIEVQKRYLTKNENSKLYFIRYEEIPDISKGFQNSIIHQAQFSNKQLAIKFSETLGNYFQEISLILDLIYTKIKQTEITVSQSEKYLKIDFNKVENSRIRLMQKSALKLPASIHIENIKSFINSLKYWCFSICKNFQNVANQLFKMLLDVEESFINNYRSAQILSEKNQLKVFL